MKPKVIIIDKDTFEGISCDDLCNFVTDHFLVLPMNLYGECATNEENRQILFGKFRKIIICGGHTCSSGKYIIEEEGRSLLPFDFQSDVDKETKEMRQKFEKGYVFSKPDKIIYKNYDESAQALVDYHRIVALGVGSEEFKSAAEEVRKLNTDRENRFTIWARTVKNLNIHDLAVRSKLSKSPEKYCLSTEWISWHYLRVATILAFEYTYLGGKVGRYQLTNAEHDLHDEEYVFLLSKADGLLTRDNKLVRPLAKAAFPEKDVFSDLDEVPEKYVGYWS